MTEETMISYRLACILKNSKTGEASQKEIFLTQAEGEWLWAIFDKGDDSVEFNAIMRILASPYHDAYDIVLEKGEARRDH